MFFQFFEVHLSTPRSTLQLLSHAAKVEARTGVGQFHQVNFESRISGSWVELEALGWVVILFHKHRTSLGST